MSKRKLTRRQSPGEEPADSELGPEQEGLVIAQYGEQVEVEARTGERQRCYLGPDLKGLVPGDHVVWCASDPTGVVVTQLERASELIQTDNHGNLKAVAANIGRLFIVIAPTPEPRANLIDRYLVAASALDIEPLILLNKTDLLVGNTELNDRLQKLLEAYEELDYQVVRASVNEDNLDELKAALADYTSVLVGQSGVGKSSLVNALLAGATPYKDKGTATTTTAVLSHLSGGGSLVDSPDVREFGLWQLSLEEVSRGFREMLPHISRCRFSNCSHLHEPGCAIIDALAAGYIRQERLDSYRHIVAGLKQSSI